MHARQSSCIRIADPCHLNWRRAARKSIQTIACCTADEINEDIYLILNDLCNQFTGVELKHVYPPVCIVHQRVYVERERKRERLVGVYAVHCIYVHILACV